jgi:chitin disaccharide deacetylase
MYAIANEPGAQAGPHGPEQRVRGDMLIINADDYGRSVPETDSATLLVRRGRVTSLSAMVFMKDSERAAELARDSNTDVGLHVNFCEPWDNQRVPGWLRAHQDSLIRFFSKGRYTLLLYNPGLRQAFDAVYQAEVEEFVRLYGRAPSHIDGHRHLHLCANMVIDGVIPPGSSVRRNFTFDRTEKGRLNRAYRRIVDNFLRREYALTDYFFSLENCLNGRGRSLNEVAELAKNATVEVMTHPTNLHEFQCLDGERSTQILQSVTKGTHAQLAETRARGLKPLIWGILAGLCECGLL